MVCKYCSTEFPDGGNYCPVCGSKVEKEEVIQNVAVEIVEAENVQPIQTEEEIKQQDSQEKRILIFSIIGLGLGLFSVFADLSTSGWLALILSPFAFVMAIVGLIFSIKQKKKVKAYVKNYGQLKGMAKVGNILSIIGIIVSCFAIVGAIGMAVLGLLKVIWHSVIGAVSIGSWIITFGSWLVTAFGVVINYIPKLVEYIPKITEYIPKLIAYVSAFIEECIGYIRGLM